jgi:transcriptional regulator with XRE-family HTH domain
MSRGDGLDGNVEQPPRFARLLNRLFLTRLTTDPNGLERPYTLREVAQRTGLSIGYLSEARRGGIENPSVDKIELLAAFFGVRPGYFFGESGEAPREAERHAPGNAPRSDAPTSLGDALNEPLLDQIVHRAGALSAVEQSMVLEVIGRLEGMRNLGSDQAPRQKEKEPRASSDPGSNDE